MSILFVNHHDAHSANGFLLSGFDEAAILSMDGRGENQTCMLAKGFGNKISRIKSVFMPHSLGLFYGAFTEYLGFRPDSDEWKVMALASYGKSNNPYYKKLRDIIQLRQNGGFEIDLSYFDYYLFDRQPAMYSKKLTGLLGKPRSKDDKISDAHIQIAAATQQIFEETAAHMLRHLYKAAKRKNLVLSGGCAMNSVFNGKAALLTDFRDVFVSSCPDDSGNAIGAALYAYNCIFGRRNRYAMKDNYWGPEFSDKEIKETLDKYKAKYVFRKDIAKVTARLISEGKLAGWFQGRMEFGQRALGNRSILADPRDIKSKELVNRAVKYRESFRPFAPSVLGEYTGDYFDIPKGAEVPFMEKVSMVRQGKRQKIPAVVHVDGTGRAQTVSRHTNPLFYDLIDEFRKITGVPVVLNTSFNLNGEPIVCSPTDAIRTFVSCGLDCLAMGNYLILKENHHD
jgi:carbamoyltransferase